MPTEDVGGLVVRFYEALHNDHDLTMFDTAVDPKVVCRWSGLPELHGPGELRAAVAADLEGFPDQAIVLEQIIVDGKLVENWTVFDNYDLMRQLGILPDTEGAVG